MNGTFINAKTGAKRAWPTTVAVTKEQDTQSRLDELRDMLEEVLAILQDSAEGSSPVPDKYVYNFVLIRLSHIVQTYKDTPY